MNSAEGMELLQFVLGLVYNLLSFILYPAGIQNRTSLIFNLDRCAIPIIIVFIIPNKYAKLAFCDLTCIIILDLIVYELLHLLGTLACCFHKNAYIVWDILYIAFIDHTLVLYCI